MAELEALFFHPESRRGEVKQSGWRKELPRDKQIKLGRVPGPGYSDWCVEEDQSISRVNATLLWDGTALQVEQWQTPGRKTSDIYFREQPAAKFAVPPGESFVIGTTRFTVYPAAGSGLAESARDDAPTVEASLSRDVLRQSPFDNAEVVLRALEELPDVLRLVTEDGRLYQKAVDILLKAVGRAEAVAVVQLAPDSTRDAPRVSVPCHKLRRTAGDEAFTVSRRLTYKALAEERKSVLWVWGGGRQGQLEFTVRAVSDLGTPWAICTPLRDDSGLGLYVDGTLAPVVPVRGPTPAPAGGLDPDLSARRRELTGYQKVVELMASILEAMRRSHSLERLIAGYRPFLPRPVRAAATDPQTLETLLTPRQATVTVLFCDLRGSCRIAEDGDLARTWEKVSDALDEMASIITEQEGVVAGFQGDAVMAFWGWPEDQPDQVDRAVRAALRIQDRFRREGWWHDLSCGIGVAHGPAVAGRLGTHDLAKVDVFGPVVNLAARLEGYTKRFGVRVMVDEAVARQVAGGAGRRRARTRKLARIVPAGMSTPQLVYELLPADAAASMSEAQRLSWEQAVDGFLTGDWRPARATLEEYFPDDPAARILLDRMTASKSTPPAGWDGVMALEGK